MSDNRTIFLKQIKDKLDEVSPSMCLAKWNQTTVYLNTGHTHSCHHPAVHPIPLEGLAENPGQIHNTPHKMAARQQMLDGVRPPECEYCWRIEDLPGEHVSDRIAKSSYDWSEEKYKNIIASGTGPQQTPTYLEVLFESTCNFACAYCMPAVSSKWADESRRLGPYKLKHNFIGIVDDQRNTAKADLAKADTNPYIEAFWKALPSWWDTLNTFRITGGEPLLSKHTWSMMDFVEQNANKQLTFAVNTNLNVPDGKIDLLIKRINEISPNLQAFQVFTSVEATGKQAEYIRYGMDYQVFIENVERILSETKSPLTVMTTINALSYSTFHEFVLHFMKLKRTYGGDRIRLSFNYLRHPTCLDVKYLPTEIKHEFAEEIQKLLNIEYKDLLNSAERIELERFKEYMLVEPTDAEKKAQQDDLRAYTQQMDARRGLDFPNTFPRLDELLPKI